MDRDGIIVLQNELTNVLKLSRDIEQLLCDAMNWLLENVGYANISIWLAGGLGDQMLPGAYMKYDISGEKELVSKIYTALTKAHVADNDLAIISCNQAYGLQDIPELRDHQMAVMKAMYLGEALALIAVFRAPGLYKSGFSDDHMAALKVFKVIIPTAMANIVKSRYDDEGAGEEKKANSPKHSDADWWKRGGEPPY
jgi:hypothetical protein